MPHKSQKCQFIWAYVMNASVLNNQLGGGPFLQIHCSVTHTGLGLDLARFPGLSLLGTRNILLNRTWRWHYTTGLVCILRLGSGAYIYR